jgi:hypothetical protein
MRPGYDRPRQQVVIGDRDLTDRCDSLTYSATDQGGFEICTLGLPSVDRPKKGLPITVRQGLEVAWAGRVAEISDHSQHGRATKTTGGEGLRALMRDNPYSMVYVDRDLTRWGAPSLARQTTLLGLNNQLGSSAVAPDQTSGNPAIVQSITDSWVAPNTPICEAWYDAGPGNLIAAIYFDVIPQSGSVNWQEFMILSSDANASVTEATANLQGPESTGFLNPATACRFALAQHKYAATPAGAQGDIFNCTWKSLATYGNHGLNVRGALPGGFYPSDIARHALSQCKGILPGVIQDAIGLIVPHCVYRTPTAPDVIVTDMAKLMGWTWGVWEPSGVFGSQPRMDFRPPPTDATCVVTKAECDQLDVTSRLGDLYSTAIVSYTDPAGSSGLAVVNVANPQLAETGIAGRTLLLNMGAGSAVAAVTFGQIALALSQVASRAAGQATLPASVRLPYGGSKPAHLLRPGIDRLRIVDLVDGGPLLDVGTVRRDVFRISRTETTVGKDGTPSTRVELDSGSNLMETLQARLSLAAGVVGAGASGG